MLLTVATPMYNEEATVRELYERLVRALEGIEFEFVVADDGSRDGTGGILDEIAAADARVRVLHLSRNFGHQTAITAALDHARGDVTVMMDSDLQDPPELIPEMLAKWREGNEVVYAVRRERAGESSFKLRTASLFYRLFSRVSKVDVEHNSGDFRLLDRRALDALGAMRETNRFLRGMTGWVGFTQASVTYDRDPRHGGETKYTLSRMLRFAVDAIASFSYVPLQAATALGFLFSALALIGIPLAILARFADIFVPGITSTIVVVLLLGGVQLITLGVIGEYLGRIYDEVKQRPLYVVREGRNIPEEEIRRSSR